MWERWGWEHRLPHQCVPDSLHTAMIRAACWAQGTAVSLLGLGHQKGALDLTSEWARGEMKISLWWFFRGWCHLCCSARAPQSLMPSLYFQNPGIDIGDVSERRALRKSLKCKNFQWYLDHVYPEMRRYNNTIAYGEVIKTMHVLSLDGYAMGCILLWQGKWGPESFAGSFINSFVHSFIQSVSGSWCSPWQQDSHQLVEGQMQCYSI